MVHPILKELPTEKDLQAKFQLAAKHGRQTLTLALESLIQVFKKEIAHGNTDGLVSLLSGQASASNPIVAKVHVLFAERLQNDLVFTPVSAQALAKALVPLMIEAAA